MSNALVILCGGDSSRMGTDKALLPFQKDKCLVEYIYYKFRPYFDKIYLSVSERGVYSHLGLDAQELPDIYRNAGPIGGILSSIAMITEDRAFVMSVDTPFLDPALGLYLLEHSGNFDLTTFRFPTNSSNYICAVYNKKCIAALGKALTFTNMKQKSVTMSDIQYRCYTNLIDITVIRDICKSSYSRLFMQLTDRDSYFNALYFAISDY